MRNILLLLLVCCGYTATAQIFGNSEAPDYGSYQGNHVVWFKLTTGASDSGEFTHYGLYDHPTQGNDCAVKLSIYSDHATSDRPEDLLVDDYIASPTDGVWNEYELGTPLTYEASTTYWIGLRCPCTYGSGRIAGETWAEQPLKYYSSWSFNSSWPDPVNPGSLSTFGSVNNVSLYLVGNGQVLPVELVSFDVIEKNRAPHLVWEVASEINNEGWHIQRSKNGFSWETIGEVLGRGTASTESSYSYTDASYVSGRVFYRLEQQDYDGGTAYTDVKTISIATTGVEVYPTVVNDFVRVRGLSQSTTYLVRAADQTVVMSGNLQPGEQLQMQDLASGVYFISIGQQTTKLVKQ